VNQRKHVEYLVIGAGPTGLSSISEILTQGVDPSAILVIDPEEKLTSGGTKNLTTTRRKQSILDVAVRERQNLGMGKGSQSLSRVALESGAYSWGLSCLPPINFETMQTFVSKVDFMNDYKNLMLDWRVQAEPSNSNFQNCFPIYGEELNALRRKKLSIDLVSADSRILHSRLALSSINMDPLEGCDFSGKCFDVCPNNSPWNPQKGWRKIKNRFPEVEHLQDWVVKLSPGKKSISTKKQVITYEKLILSAGWRSTSKLIRTFNNQEFTFQNTPVVLLPIYFRAKVSEQDFYEHFNYTDLIIPEIKHGAMVSLSQIYLPTSEIAGRIIAQMPQVLFSIAKKFRNKDFHKLFNHVGVVMIFLPPTISSVNQKDIQEDLNQVVRYLNGVLGNVGAKVLNFKTNYLLNGSSHHVGAIGDSTEKDRGVNSRIFDSMFKSKIFITDTSALPVLLPGPHTATSAALSKSISRMAVHQ
jgi:hypothetical protein